MPSRLKLGVRADLMDVGDFRGFVPFVLAVKCGEGISMVKSLVGTGKCLLALVPATAVSSPVAERGESPLEEGDMLEA